MHAPGEAPPPGRREDLVLLRVVEVLDGQPRHLLAERRLRLGLRVGLERPEVMLQAGDEGDVPEALGRVEGGEQVPHHGAVHRAILRLGRLAHPGRDEDVGGVDAGERRPAAPRGSSRSAATGRTPGMPVCGLRARPWTSQPLETRCAARLFPTMPVTPAMSALCVMARASFSFGASMGRCFVVSLPVPGHYANPKGSRPFGPRRCRDART